MGLWSWIKRLFGKKEEDSPPISLVMFLQEPRFLTKEILINEVKKSFGVELSDDPDSTDSTDFIAGGDEIPTYFIQFQGHTLVVHNIAMPYFDEPEKVAEHINELRLRKVVLEHRAWLSVDAYGMNEDEDPYQYIGKLVASLVDTDCLALYSPATDQITIYDPAMEETLRGPQPLEVFDQNPFVPVTSISEDNPDFKAAVEEAKRRWPEFVAAFEKRQPDQVFGVKVPFQDGDDTEFMWISVSAIEGDSILGKLDNDPVDVKTVKAGDQVRIQLADLNDWAYMEENEMKGGFTVKILTKQVQGPE